MRVAIVGGGIAGVSLSWHLLPYAHVELFDPKGIGGGASGIATGLLHPFPGRHAYHSWRAEEGIAATLELVDLAEKTLGVSVAEKSGLFRPAIAEHQKENFSVPKEGALWCEKPPFGQGLWIPNGTTIFTSLFLKGLWTACEARGAKLCLEKVASLEQLSSFDQIVLATGAETLHFPECRHLPLKVTKGQALLCRWPEKLPFPLLSLGHITPTEDPSFCQIGSTYEHHYSSLDPDPATALELLDKAALFYPPARTFEVVAIRSGARIAQTGTYKPLIQQIAPKAWVFTGFGSRGLLYGPLLARELVNKIKESFTKKKQEVRFGVLKGKIRLSKNFSEPLIMEEWEK